MPNSIFFQTRSSMGIISVRVSSETETQKSAETHHCTRQKIAQAVFGTMRVSVNRKPVIDREGLEQIKSILDDQRLVYERQIHEFRVACDPRRANQLRSGMEWELSPVAILIDSLLAGANEAGESAMLDTSSGELS